MSYRPHCISQSISFASAPGGDDGAAGHTYRCVSLYLFSLTFVFTFVSWHIGHAEKPSTGRRPRWAQAGPAALGHTSRTGLVAGYCCTERGAASAIASAASHYGDGAYPNGAQRAGKQPASPGPRGSRRVLLDGGHCGAATSATSSCHAAAAVAAPYGAAAAAGDAHCAYAGPATDLLSARHTTSLTSIPTPSFFPADSSFCGRLGCHPIFWMARLYRR